MQLRRAGQLPWAHGTIPQARADAWGQVAQPDQLRMGRRQLRASSSKHKPWGHDGGGGKTRPWELGWGGSSSQRDPGRIQEGERCQLP